MSTILAHRGNVDGPSAERENRVPAMREALGRGWGLEIDIRRDARGRFYLSHDPRPSADGLRAEDACAEWRRHPAAPIAINLKECGYEADLVRFLAEQGVLPQSYVFDMELIEPEPGATARLLRSLHPDVRVAARVSDRGESVDRALRSRAATVIWLDEFDGPWATAADVGRLKAAGRIVHAVSPDLHQFPLTDARARWRDFLRWGVDGICTDYPAELERELAGVETGAPA